MGGTSVGGRLSRHRRNRIPYLALLRRSSNYTMHAWYIRVTALVIIAALSIGSRSSVLAIALCLVASLGSYLLWANERHLRLGTQAALLAVPGLSPQRDQDRWRAPAKSGLLLRDPRSVRTDRHSGLDRHRRSASGAADHAGRRHRLLDHHVVADLQRPHLVQSRRDRSAGLARDHSG